MRNKALVLISLIAFTIQLSAQTSMPGEKQTPVTFNKAIELYQTSNFIAAERLFTDLINESSKNSPLLFDLEYYRLMCLVKQNKRVSESEIQSYLDKTNGSPWENQLWYELAKLQFSNKRYPLAARNFKKVDKNLLSKSDKEDFAFFSGYSNFEAGNLNEAKQAFFEVKRSRSTYSPSASYYWGYINYLEGNYKTALDEFSTLENNREFKGFIDYYTIQIYYLMEDYDKVIEIGEDLVRAAPAEQKNEILKIVGDAFYENNKFINAIKYLDEYEGVNGRKAPEDFYRLGYCYYQIKDYNKAITNFEKATGNKDLMAQNAYYHLADCYLKTDSKNKARVAFEQASKYDFDPKIERDALFNYAKLTYELSYSPFNETIKAFDQYINKYPDSKRNDAAFNYLVKVYMTTKNYGDAITSIEKIKNQSPSIKEALQRVTFYRGLELLNDGHYKRALEFFDKSLENGQYNRRYNAETLYWMGETHYRTLQYDKAIEYFERFQKAPGAFSLPEFGTAYYNVGYSYFNQKIYDKALDWFRKYINQSKKEPKMEADASNRIGDCFFLNRQFAAASEYYGKARILNSYDPDYAMFQEAICYGLDDNQNRKNELLAQLIESYPISSFVDDALYEIARTNERQNNIQEAINGYNRLISDAPQSNFVKKGRLQLGLIYYNNGNTNASLENFKKVVEQYPNSEESKAALLGIKNNYIDMNNVDEYFAYVNTLDNQITISVNEQDSIFYMAAEKSYMEGNTNAAGIFQQYLERYPEGSFRTSALFYLAESLYGNEQFSKSLEYYKQVIDKPDNIFTEQALIKAGELTFNAEDYQTSLNFFSRLEQLASTKWNLIKARLGVMRSNFALNRSPQTIKAAIVLLATENITDIMKREAHFKLAKSYYLTGEENEALKYFNLLIEDTKSIEGAESKFFKAQILFNKNKYDEAENEIMDFISKSTPHKYWLAKSFILLSDVYREKNDIFQAKHTLKSIIDNYNNDTDGIIEEANKKIAEIEQIEKKSIIIDNETPDSTNIISQ
ncbi:MAG: tetratricopeptide repeat protein [Prolixibacteraceae bacterium]|jgi:tetratricopeptide (TPR) repeat protein|nr:tetratricopeptide repeat protein [Prolixibacteraceae bacterium]